MSNSRQFTKKDSSWQQAVFGIKYRNLILISIIIIYLINIIMKELIVPHNFVIII